MSGYWEVIYFQGAVTLAKYKITFYLKASRGFGVVAAKVTGF